MNPLPRVLALGAFSCLLLPVRAEEGVHDLSIGEAAPDFALIGTDDKIHRLADYTDGKLLMIFFTSNHCPTTHGVAGRLRQFLAEYRGRGLTFVAINPNHPDGLGIDELGYSKYGDGFEDMKRYAAEEEFDFPYLYDGETQAVAKAYGCLATPHVFIFDAGRRLRYKGRFDDSRYPDPATVKSPDARNAVEALLAGREVPVAVTKPHGCSTKWIGKHAGIAARMENWDRTPVDVETIDAAGVAALRKGGTGKLRLYNVWATWCAPCVEEFPALVSVSRRFDARNFEFISISMDRPADLAKPKEFLEQRGAGLSDRLRKAVRAEGRATNSYLFTGGDMENLMHELDPGWAGGIPHTVLVDAGGKVVWRHTGIVDGAALTSVVLGLLGNHYQP